MGVPLSSLYGVRLTREELRRRTGRSEQLLGAELVERADGSERGVRCVRLRSGAIELEVVVDRALDLAQATVGGVPVAWISPTGLAAPGLAVPTGWEPFRTFFGGSAHDLRPRAHARAGRGRRDALPLSRARDP